MPGHYLATFGCENVQAESQSILDGNIIKEILTYSIVLFYKAISLTLTILSDVSDERNNY